MPLRVHELLASVDAAIEESELRKKKARQQPKQRNVLDKQQIMLAKDLLIEPLTEDAIKEYDDDIEKSVNSKGIRNIHDSGGYGCQRGHHQR